MVLCYAMLCYAMLCYAMLCYAMLCYAMPCHAMPCHAMPYAVQCYVILYFTIFYIYRIIIMFHDILYLQDHNYDIFYIQWHIFMIISVKGTNLVAYKAYIMHLETFRNWLFQKHLHSVLFDLCTRFVRWSLWCWV